MLHWISVYCIKKWLLYSGHFFCAWYENECLKWDTNMCGVLHNVAACPILPEGSGYEIYALEGRNSFFFFYQRMKNKAEKYIINWYSEKYTDIINIQK